jgi:D-glycero-alpha-D-manno-heptose-7-phosphate kinase
MKNCLLERRLRDFGRLMHEEWTQKKRLSTLISTAPIDAMYDAALRAGAIGGKVSGAGGGGYLLLYCEFERKHRAAQALRALGGTVYDCSFSPFGLQTWRVPSPCSAGGNQA